MGGREVRHRQALLALLVDGQTAGRSVGSQSSRPPGTDPCHPAHVVLEHRERPRLVEQREHPAQHAHGPLSKSELKRRPRPFLGAGGCSGRPA